MQLVSRYPPLLTSSERTLVELHNLFIVRHGVTLDAFILMISRCPFIGTFSFENNILPKVLFSNLKIKITL